EDAHAAAADQAVVPAVIVVEREGEDFRAAAGVEGAEGTLLDLRLDAASAEGPALAAVGEDEHGGAGLLGRGAARLDEQAVDQVAALIEGRGQLGEKLAHGGGRSSEGARNRVILPPPAAQA